MRPAERVETPALRSLRDPDGAGARPLPVPGVPLHPSLLRLVAPRAFVVRRHTQGLSSPPMADDVRVRLWETGGRWYAHILDAPAFIEVTGTSRERCIAELRKVTGDDATLIVDVVPRIVGVAEAAEIIGWDKRRVVTYIDRGQFPEPLTSLASGRIWLREDIETFAEDWRARHPRSGSTSS